MKKGNIQIDLGNLSRDIQLYANSVCRNTASLIADELTEETKTAIVTFYNDYSPEYYKRNYWNFEKNSYRRYYSNPHNKIYKGGVELTPGLMKDIYQHPKDEVFGSVMEIGSHGPELYTSVSPMRPSPIEMVNLKRDEILQDINSYINKAKIHAKNETYSILMF